MIWTLPSQKFYTIGQTPDLTYKINIEKRFTSVSDKFQNPNQTPNTESGEKSKP